MDKKANLQKREKLNASIMYGENKVNTSLLAKAAK